MIADYESLSLPMQPFISRCKEWMDEFNNGDLIKIDDYHECPLHVWVVENHNNCGKDTVPNTASCPICGLPCCPVCMNHNVEQLSRVTGYMSSVSGWNAAKKQEFQDRQRHDVLRM